MSKFRIFILPVLFVLVLGACSSSEKTPEVNENGEMTMSKIEKLIAKADSTFNARDYVASRDIYLEALSAAEAENDNSSTTEALSMIARTYLITGDGENGGEWLARAEKMAVPEEPLGWSRYVGVKGRFLWQDKKLDEATGLFKDMYDYCSRNKLYDRAIDAAHMVAITGSHEEQVEWGKKGIKEAEAGNVTGWMGPLWNNLGATYEEMEKYDSSLQAYLKAREYHHKYGNETGAVIADWAVGHAYVNLKDYDEAVKWLTPVLAKLEALDNGEFIGLTCRELGEVSFAANDYIKALSYFERAEKLLKEAGMDSWDADGYQKIKDRIAACKTSK